jgi:putative protein-disulfide isomerase
MRKLTYVADPMCSWCWGFRTTLEAVHGVNAVHGVHEEVDARDDLKVEYIMGGLAPDSDEPMPAETQAYVQDQWRKVTAETGAKFNWDFWETCTPRRSTYPACRAVIAAERQGAGRSMFEAIQKAYYQEARNPSDLSTLSALAAELELDQGAFDLDIVSARVESDLQAGFEVRRSLRANEFPSLILQTSESSGVLLARGYGDAPTVLGRLKEALAESGAD